MVKRTQREIIDDLEKQVDKLKTQLNYEAIKPIKAIKADLRELKKHADTYPLFQDKVNNLWRGFVWVISIVGGAVVLAVINGVLQ
mgnify:CR=1 FL=1